MYFVQIQLSGEESSEGLEFEGETNEENPLKVDICCIGLEELSRETEVLRCHPCGCLAACSIHARIWVDERQSCYLCRTKLNRSEAVPNFYRF